LIQEGTKVLKGPLPSWVRPKRATKGCDWHAKQDTVRQKLSKCDDSTRRISTKCSLTAAVQKLFKTTFIRHPESESGRTLQRTSDGEERTNWL